MSTSIFAKKVIVVKFGAFSPAAFGVTCIGYRYFASSLNKPADPASNCKEPKNGFKNEEASPTTKKEQEIRQNIEYTSRESPKEQRQAEEEDN